jgi:hypothetical protein
VSSYDNLIKRLDELLRRLRITGSRTIVVKVPTALTAVEGSVQCRSSITPETEQAVGQSCPRSDTTRKTISSFRLLVSTHRHRRTGRVNRIRFLHPN